MTMAHDHPIVLMDDTKAEVEHNDDVKFHETGTLPLQPLEDDPRWLHGWKLWLSLSGMAMAQFITSFGGNMLSPAFNTIVNNFDAAEKFGWVGSAFFMAQCPCMLLFGQILSAFDGKKVLLTSVGFFTLGAIVCGSAQNIEAVIVGRAIAGIGASGIWVGVLSLIAAVVPLVRRPLVMGTFGWVNLVANATGPVLAGYFADSVTWRLCFLFDLPLAAITIATIWFFVPKQNTLRPFSDHAGPILDKRWHWFSKSEPHRESLLYRLLGVDWIGFAVITGAVVCLQIAIQDGNGAWTSPRILGLLIGGFVGLFVVFLLWQWYAGETALMPLAMFNNRTQYGACLLSMACLYCNLVGVIVLPYFFEVAMSSTSLQAGYQILPYLLVTIVFSFISGVVSSKTGHFWQWLIVGPSFLVISGALYYTMPAAPSNGQLYGYQILLAAGVGFTQQQIYVAVQSTSRQEDIHLRIASVSFAELFGGAIAPTVSMAVLNSKLAANFAKYAPDAPPTVMQNTGLIATLEPALAAAVRLAYIKSLHPVFIQLCALGGISLLTAILLVKPVNLKKVSSLHLE